MVNCKKYKKRGGGSKPFLIIVAGPTGCGKGTLPQETINYLLQSYNDKYENN